MKIQNAKTLPQVYFGLHMVEGVAEYREPGQAPYRVMIRNDAIKNMDPTFQGRPVYVRHVESVDLENLQAEADGYVIDSFFNKSDGKHWAKFIVVSDKGHEAIRNGWRLSNCYKMKNAAGGGQWNGVDYSKEVLSGEYEHLAIVSNPRYDSVIMTPEQFKQYNSDKEIELLKLSNSKEETKGMLKFFKKQRVENSTDLEGASVLLPKSNKEITIEQLVKNADDMEMNSEKQMCNEEHHVMVGDEKMKVNELVAKHQACMNELEEMKKKNSEMPEDDKKKNEEEEMLAKKKNEEDAEKKKGEEKLKEEEKKKNALHFETLRNADKTKKEKTVTIDLPQDQVARGKNRYGSN